MVSNRRQRHQKEGSFLEHVRDALAQLSAELSHVKDLVADMKVSQVNAVRDSTGYGPCAYWLNDYVWSGGNFDGCFHSGFTPVDSSHILDTDALPREISCVGESTAAMTQPVQFTCEELLGFKGSFASSEVPIELETLSTSVWEADEQWSVFAEPKTPPSAYFVYAKHCKRAGKLE